MWLLRRYYSFLVLLLLGNVAVAQQLKLGVSPHVLNKSAVLELSSGNQGLLFPRLSDTVGINALNPPDGMVIYFAPTRQLMIRTRGYWNPVMVSSDNTSGNGWLTTGNTNVAAGSFLGTLDDRALILKSANSNYAEFGRRQTLGLVQSYADYTDASEPVLHMKAAIQFHAPAASFYKPKIFVDAAGNFRTKGSSAGTDFFEFGATGANNDGGFEFIIGDDGNEPIVFKSYHYQNGMSEMMRLQSGRMAIGSNAFNTTNPEKLLIDAGNTTSYNLMTGKGSIDNYLQINVQNRSATGNASSDIVATADNGDENGRYIDMGINSSAFTNNTYPMIGGANNAYLYATGNDFIIGNATAGRPLRFFTGGYALANERLRIDGNGRVGIGNVSPAEVLDVTGNLRFSGALMPGGLAGTAGFLLQSNGAGVAPTWINGQTLLSSTAWMQDGNSLSAIKRFGTTTNYALPFITNNVERMRLTNTGNLGIGTVSPATALHVVGTNPLTLTGVQTGGTTASDSVLTINAGTVQKLPLSQFGTAATTWNTTGNNATTASHFLGTTHNASLRFRTNNLQRMIVDSVGNVGIGTSTFDPVSPEKLLVDAGTSTYTPIMAQGNYNGYFQINVKNNSTGSQSSSDIVATANNGTETTNFINMGINGSNFTYQAGSPIETGKANDGYLLSAGADLYVVNNNPIKDIIFLAGGTATTNEAMRITAAEKLGIGTTTPSERLHVVLPTASGTVQTPVATVETTNTTASATSMPPVLSIIRQVPSFATNTNYVGPVLSFGFRTNGTANSLAQITTTSGPATSRISFHSRTGMTNANPATGTLAENMVLDGKNLGIGTTTPEQALDVTGNIKFSGALMPNGLAGTSGQVLQSNGAGAAPTWVNASASLGWSLGGNAVSSAQNLGTTTNVDLPFITGGTEAMRLTTGNRLGIGITNPGQTLDVNGNAGIQTSLFIDKANANTGNTTNALIFGGTTSGEAIASKRNAGGNQYGIDFYTASSNRMVITNSGNVGIGTTTPADRLSVAGVVAPTADAVYSLGKSTLRWHTTYSANGVFQTSDKRLKMNIRPLQYGLKEVMAMQPVHYNWKTAPNSDLKVGLIAQEIKTLVPEVVSGNEATENLSMNYAELVPVLVNAIKEQQIEIESLKKEMLEMLKEVRQMKQETKAAPSTKKSR